VSAVDIVRSLPRWLALAVRLEIEMYVGLVRLLTRRPAVPGGATPHPYVGAVSALLWAITAVSLVELVVLHLVIPWHGVRLAADVLGAWGVVWCAGLTACHYVYPHLVGEDALVVRRPRRTPVLRIPWADVVGVTTREASHESSKDLQLDETGRVLLVVVGGRTNVEVALARPHAVQVRGTTHEVERVRLFADDARALAADVRARS
jgi:hypothetical protein